MSEGKHTSTGENELLERLTAMKSSGDSAKLKVLDPKSDPFWISPARIRDAKWIAEVWKTQIQKKTYDRGLHYKLVSLGIECPWGKERRKHASPLYLNVDSDFNKLISAIRDARDWGLLPWDAIEDRKHVGLEKWVNYGIFPENREVKPFETFDGTVSHFLGVIIPEVDEVDEAEFVEDDFNDVARATAEQVLQENMTDLTSARYQPYYLVVISEKSGLQSILKTAHYNLHYGFDFLNFEGQASTTIVRSFVEDRLLGNVPAEHPIREKKIRIFYISDYDYAGRTMPPAFIQKLVYCLWKLNVNLDIKIKPLALTEEIVKKYDLPPAPVSLRKLGAKTLQDRWFREFGKIVEVEALDTFHPGVLEQILIDELGKYIDKNLADQVNQKLEEIKREAAEAILEAIGERKADWLMTRAKLLRAMNRINEAVRNLGVNETLRKLREELDRVKREHDIEDLVRQYKETLEDIDVDYESPDLNFTSNHEVSENEDWLFDSQRDPVEQAKILRKYRP